MVIRNWGSVEVQVAPVSLKQQAAEVSRRIERVAVLFAELESVLKHTQGYWIGEAGTLHREEYLKKRDDIDTILCRLRKHPEELLKISGNYEEAENRIGQYVSALRADVIL